MSDKEALVAAARELKDLRGIIKSQQREIEIWREISGKAYARIDELEKEGAAAVLKRERDQWRASWRNCTRRLGNCIEHRGLEHSGMEPNNDQQ
jgi:hypothetical protein